MLVMRLACLAVCVYHFHCARDRVTWLCKVPAWVEGGTGRFSVGQQTVLLTPDAFFSQGACVSASAELRRIEGQHAA